MPALVPTLRSMLESFAVRVATEIKLLAYLAKANTWTADQSFASGRVAFINATANRIDFNANGINAPGLSATPSTGTKILLNPTGSTTATDYAIGMRGNAMWFSMAANNASHLVEWFGGATRVMYLDGTGALTVVGNIAGAVIGASNFRNSSVARTSGFTLAGTSGATNLCNATTAALVVNLYSSAALPGQRFLFKKTDATANVVTVQMPGGTIDGVTAVFLYGQNAWVEVESTATAGVWVIVGQGGVNSINPYLISAVSVALQASQRTVELTAASTTATLPQASTAVGREFYVINASTGSVTVSGFTSTDTIGNDAAAVQTKTLTAAGTLHVQSNGTKWRIL